MDETGSAKKSAGVAAGFVAQDLEDETAVAVAATPDDYLDQFDWHKESEVEEIPICGNLKAEYQKPGTSSERRSEIENTTTCRAFLVGRGWYVNVTPKGKSKSKSGSMSWTMGEFVDEKRSDEDAMLTHGKGCWEIDAPIVGITKATGQELKIRQLKHEKQKAKMKKFQALPTMAKIGLEANPQTNVDWTASKELAGLMGTNKECYLNAFHALARYPDGHYVEGWVAIRLNVEDESYFPMLFNHAWIEVEGKIIDPTPCFTEDRGNVYFPAIKFNGFELAMTLSEMKKEMLPVCDFEFFRPTSDCGQAMLEAKEEGERFLYGGTIGEIFGATHNPPRIKVIEILEDDTGGPYWGGHVWVDKWKVPSESSDKIYTVSRDTNGRWGCSCMAWTRRRIECKHIRGIKAQQGHNPKPGRWQKPTKIQTIIFKSTDWTVEKAKDWLRKHGFKYNKVDETLNEIRFRQFSPEHFAKGHFRSIPFGKGRGIRAIVAEPNPGRKFKALITWIPQTKKYRVVVIDDKGERKPHLFENDAALVDGLWNIWHGFFQDEDKTKDLCPITTEWVAPPRRRQNPEEGDEGDGYCECGVVLTDENRYSDWTCKKCATKMMPCRVKDITDNPTFDWEKSVVTHKVPDVTLRHDIPPTKKAPKRRYLHACPPIAKGRRRTDDEAMEKLSECICRLQQTKVIHQLLDNEGKPIGRYTPERATLHNKIVSHIYEGVECIPEGTQPIAILTGGPPGAGKTTYMKKKIPWTDKDKTKGLLHIDADYIRAMLPEYEGWNAHITHSETQDILKRLLNDIAKPCKHDVLYDGTMGNVEKYKALILRLKEMGYAVYLVFMDIDEAESFKRVKDRYASGGRWVPDEVVREANIMANNTFKELRKLADAYIQIDGNTGHNWHKLSKGVPFNIPQNRPYWRSTQEESE